jgi:hypothetical protein
VRILNGKLSNGTWFIRTDLKPDEEINGVSLWITDGKQDKTTIECGGKISQTIESIGNEDLTHYKLVRTTETKYSQMDIKIELTTQRGELQVIPRMRPAVYSGITCRNSLESNDGENH